MPILEDIMDHDVLGPAIRQGRTEGQLELLLAMIEERFGAVPPPMRDRLGALNPSELKTAGLRLLTAKCPDDLFGS